MIATARSLCAIALLASGAATAQTGLLKVSGAVVLVDGANVELMSKPGQPLAIRLADQVRISARSPLDIGAIKEGDYLGTTAAPQPDGTLLASEVHVFAEAMRGTSEGHRPMANEPGSTMTNATVASLSRGRRQDAANDATVAIVSNAVPGELRMTLRYKDGEKVVVVPGNVPVVMMEAGDRSLLVPGVHVVAYVTKQADGELVAERLNVGKNGYVPLQ
jgi:hypothetical protein